MSSQDPADTISMGRDAMDSKIVCQLETLEVVRRSSLPSRAKPTKSKWVMAFRTDETGRINNFKARLVVKGYHERAGKAFEDTWAPTATQHLARHSAFNRVHLHSSSGCVKRVASSHFHYQTLAMHILPSTFDAQHPQT
jgi:hypothetical protein